MVTRSTSNFGLVGTDWQQRINWERLRKYRLNRARLYHGRCTIGPVEFRLLKGVDHIQIDEIDAYRGLLHVVLS